MPIAPCRGWNSGGGPHYSSQPADPYCFPGSPNFSLHRTVNHWLAYANGETHVNHVENAWSLFKRGLVGVFHHVSAKHLQEYLDEFAFRCSHRSEKAVLVDLVLASC